ncbi:hypothetical protein PHMEG_00033517 [Phytophthora megakarya]|uniref:Uncharacterized protein n=1 Tax=Phytophthora megakarya TaxID=4795 RepID=A0A225UTM4_9STRA|nr:hypothetical protein PHMEG_00033517 [Phytophthora megakarya]
MPVPARSHRPLALQVDLEELRFVDGARDFTSVIAVLQTMLDDAGYAFQNLTPTWGRTLGPELLGAQNGQVIVRRDDAPFRALDPKTAFQVEDDGDTLMLTLEEQELFGTAMVTRLRFAHVRPRDWSDKANRVWGGPIPDVVVTSSLASGDTPMLTPDENMSSVGGGSQGSPGMEPSAAMVGVYMVTTCSGTGPSNFAEQPTFYVPVTEYLPGQDARIPPRVQTPTPPMHRGSDRDGLDEETKSDDHMVGQGPRHSETGRDRDQDLRDANRQISELRPAFAAQDEQKRLRHEVYRATRAQAAQTKISREEWEYREAEYQDRATREAEKKRTSDQEFASLQAKLYLLEKERLGNEKRIPTSERKPPAG